jgi:hypothetical protein
MSYDMEKTRTYFGLTHWCRKTGICAGSLSFFLKLMNLQNFSMSYVMMNFLNFSTCVEAVAYAMM